MNNVLTVLLLGIVIGGILSALLSSLMYIRLRTLNVNNVFTGLLFGRLALIYYVIILWVVVRASAVGLDYFNLSTQFYWRLILIFEVIILFSTLLYWLWKLKQAKSQSQN